MKKLVYFLLFIVIFLTNTEKTNAFVLEDDFETYSTSFFYEDMTYPVVGKYGSMLIGFENYPTMWTRIIKSYNCHSGTTCYESKFTSLHYAFSDIATSTMNDSDDVYFSYWVYFPMPENEEDFAIGDAITNWYYFGISNSFGSGDVLYSWYCRTSDNTFSVVVDDSATGINYCGNPAYGENVGSGTFNTWVEFKIKLDTVSNTFSYALGDDWSSEVNNLKVDYISYFKTWTTSFLNDDDIEYDEGYIVPRFDDYSISSFERGVNPFTLDYYLESIDTDYNVYTTGCVSGDVTVDCGLIPAKYGIIIQSTSTAETSDFRFKYNLQGLYGETFTPTEAYSKTILNETDLYTMARTDYIIFPTTASSSYKLHACVEYNYDEFDSDILGRIDNTQTCHDMIIGNGYASSSHESLIFGNENEDIWNELGCDDIGITDVLLGVKCGLVWAFNPSEVSKTKLISLRDSVLTLYPIGYATIMINDFTTAFTSTSTDYFDREIDIARWFGLEGGTTTIDFDNLLLYKDMGGGLYDYIDFLMWFFFCMWLIMWGVSREL